MFQHRQRILEVVLPEVRARASSKAWACFEGRHLVLPDSRRHLRGAAVRSRGSPRITCDRPGRAPRPQGRFKLFQAGAVDGVAIPHVSMTGGVR
jgi:hypothetical protein